MYDMPEEIQVEADGPLRIITLNRPEELNAVNDDLHVGLARLWNRLSQDRTARAAVITGAGKAFSAGGDFNYIQQISQDADLRAKTIADGREIVIGMARCRIPVIAAVNGPAVGLGCSVVALSDIVYMAEKAFLSDPHVQVGLVAADGGPLVWPMQMSILQAKEYALTGARIPAAKAVELGLANHVVADPLAEAITAAKKILELPQKAVESTKRILNIQLEQQVMMTLDYATTAEELTFGTDDLKNNVAKLLQGNK
ncbi:enoyl-CoA hydratase/isomerase family protein [Mycolicibacterium diernhoferi]|uniref:Enoyl-CoA hydratase n=1 Tax=Mycolicibacterium diernhoferi TaxID=1801 RepID=A0A1Q4HAY4_9MYCO|nr:enoyl-CoA hydratase/isomerase family protein [Mycolicibacterium diernhoferi]OJZ64706.1 enoyl-CoA hydratase [Mycolicibacterium diernhoferi]OPE56072.1 enoyl-CoA hydratase [Mycolicibacterium diernhoferi]PEG54915.1 enoyl-CoA hydratase/isomerase family protein [Mycolicibacterium diernhoferi]QYL25031.1 enoyl-CoA hydratase/isomerase family protein [Mycolicibacterium diernhoferi]